MPLWIAARRSSVKASASLNDTSTLPSRVSGVTCSVCCTDGTAAAWRAALALPASSSHTSRTDPAPLSTTSSFRLPQLVDLARELPDVAKLPVDRREPDVGDLIELFELLHQPRADLFGRHLPLRALLQFRLDAIGD